jgi:hypothetical protein
MSSDNAHGLHIPDIDPDADNLTAALTLATAGWFVLPVKRGTKNPGSVVGKGWQHRSSREPDQIAAWFAGTDHVIALHCGRSGALGFDVDHPDRLPDVLAPHLKGAPFQATRPDSEPGRGHYIFAMPAGRTIGNSGGRLGGSWGEVRGLNGVIIVAPHPDGRRWERTGTAPTLPEELAELLDDASPAEDAATDEAVAAFIAEHTAATRPDVLQGWDKALRKRYFAGESRHMSTVSVLAGAMKEARVGLFSAQGAIDVLRPMFLEAVGKPPSSAKQNPPRDGKRAAAEFAGILAWAVAQALAADPEAVRARTETTMSDRSSVATQLVRFVLDEYTLGITDTEDPFGIHPDRPHLAMMLRGGKTGLRAEMARCYFHKHKTAVSQQALADACATLEGFAAQQNPQPVALRVAQAGGAVYIDMGADGHVIEISGGTWRITTTAPVLFRRTKLTGEIAKPVAGDDISRLWKFVPVNEDDRPLILAWLVAALIQPDVAHPILALLAEQGSAKSTITRHLVSLVDPSPVPVRKAPRDAEGWVTAANASWVVALDNMSGVIPLWLSDCLCRACTGDGDVRRALYTDQDVSLIAYRRVIMLNGIDIIVTQGDLAERLLRVKLPRITQRIKEAELAAGWVMVRPQLLGALLDLAAQVHDLLPRLTVRELPRMADYALLLAGIDEILGTEGFAQYQEQSKRVAADTLDEPFIGEVLAARYSCTDKSAAEILGDIERILRDDADRDWREPKGWPQSSREVTVQLMRHAPAMRAQGWDIEDDGGNNKRHATLWTIFAPATREGL